MKPIFSIIFVFLSPLKIDSISIIGTGSYPLPPDQIATRPTHLPSRLGEVLLQLLGHRAVDVPVAGRIARDPARKSHQSVVVGVVVVKSTTRRPPPTHQGCASASLHVYRCSTLTHIRCRMKSLAESLISSQYGESNSNSPFRICANRFASFSS